MKVRPGSKKREKKTDLKSSVAQSMYRKKSSARQLSFLLLFGRTHRQTSSEMATFCSLRAGKNNGERGRGAAKS